MIHLYTWPTPNGWKLTIALEELGLPYELHPVDITRGAQFEPGFLAISPNNRIPALVDDDPPGGGPPFSSFESGAMLLYLAEKTGRLLPTGWRGRHAVLPWLLWQVGGLGPMLGQHGHFKLYASDKIPYAIDRYEREARRLYGVLDGQLARQHTAGCSFIAGDYSVADIAVFPWVMTHKAQGFTLDDWPAVKRWFAELRVREAVQRGLAAGKAWRPPRAADAPMDAETRRHLFGSAPAPEPSTPTPAGPAE